MNAAAVLRVIVEAQTGPANASLARFDSNLRASAAAADAAMGRISKGSEKAAAAGKRMEATGRSISGMGKHLAFAVAPLAAIGVVSVKSAMDFKRSMGLIATDAGGSAREVKKLETQVLGLAKHTAFGPQKLADSLFHVESSGYRGAKAMRVLNESQKLAISGNSDLESTTYALVSATKALNSGDSLKGITKTAAQLNEVVSHGDIRLEELTAAMSTGLLPTARGLGLGIADVGSALDVMTKRGVPAQRSAYALNFTLQKLIPSTEKAQGVFEELGIGQEQLLKVAQGQGLPAALDLLKEKLEGLPKGRQIQKIDEMFGGGRMSKGLLIAIQHVGEMKQLYGEVDGNVQLYKKHVREAEQQPLVKMKTAWSSIQADLVEIGGDLLPTVVPMFEQLVGLADGAAHAFTGMSPGLQSAAVEATLIGVGLSGTLIVGGKLIEAIGAIRVAMAGLAATNAITALTGGLGDLRAALSLALGGEMGGLSMVGGQWAGALMGGLTRALPPLAAAAGIGNIVISAAHGDWEGAGYKAGGALVGGIAGAFLGPEGAMVGAGLGSMIGGLLEPTKKLTPLQRQMAASAHHVAEAMGNERNSAKGLGEAQEVFRGAAERSKRALHALIDAEKHLDTVRQNHKQGSLAIFKAEVELGGRRRAETKATYDQLRAEENLRFARETNGRSIGEVVHASIVAIATEEKHRKVLEARIRAEGRTPELQEKAASTVKRLAGYQEDLNNALQHERNINPDQAAKWEAMTTAQHRFGAEGKVLVDRLDQIRGRIHGLQGERGQWGVNTKLHVLHDEAAKTEQRIAQFISHTTPQLARFASTGAQSAEHLSGGFESLAGNVGGALESIQGNLAGMLKSLGAAKVSHFQVKKFVKTLPQLTPMGHQAGGFIVPGSGSGDSVPARVPHGSFVMNREATAAFGLQSGGHVPVVLEPKERVFMPHEVARYGLHNLAAMNGAVPRFQKGGSLGPEPHLAGPSGALRALGQGAIHDIYSGAQHYLAAHKPKGGVSGLNVPTGPIQQMAHQMILRVWDKSQWAPFVSVEMQEAGWDPHAQNPTSTAYGLAQNLNPSTYPAAGRPGSTAPILEQAKAQLQWMVNYIKGRYGSPAAAWAHEQSAGWYAKGGHITPHGPPLFTGEGPSFYNRALKHNLPWAEGGPPWETQLGIGEESQFEAWLKRNPSTHWPLHARKHDYDMRGYWKGSGHTQGGHYPDAWKTPYDTTFSKWSKYAKPGTPFDWRGDWLVDLRTGREIASAKFAQGGSVGAQNEALHKKAQRIWEVAAPFYGQSPGSPAPPVVGGHFRRAQEAETVHAGFDGAKRSEVKFGPGLIKALLSGKGNLRNTAEETLLHEWAHYFQPPLGQKEWEFEGGAEAFARRYAPGVYSQLGIPYATPRFNGYPEFTKKVIADKGWPWIEHGQFAGHQQGGLVQRLATGGHVTLQPGVNMKVGDEPAILGNLKSLSGNLGETVYVISGYRTPQHSVEVGGFANDPHTKGEAADIGAGAPTLASMQSVSESSLHGVNLYRPFSAASEINHVQLWHGGGSGSGTAKKETVPAVFHGARTHKLSFGAVPKSLHGVEREIARREREVRLYRHAAAAASGAPATQRAIQANVTALETRLNQLRDQRHKLRQEHAKKKLSRHLSRSLGQVTGYETLIAGKQREYEMASEFASQKVDLEPQQPILPGTATEAEREAAEKAYVASYEGYLNTQERPAYERVLGREADWRNSILRAEFFGFGKGHPSAAGLERDWEGQIRKADNEIERINAFTKNVSGDVSKWQAEHPKKGPKDYPDWLKAEIKKEQDERAKLPMLRYKDRELRKVLGEARSEFYPGFKDAIVPPSTPLPGSGTLEDDLIEVQGTHWPDQHSLLGAGALAPPRQAGHFGGAIWDTQTSIEELGINIAQAQSSLGSPSSGPDDSERVQLLEELLRQKTQKEIVRGIEKETFAERDLVPHAGSYAGGGIVTALVGEKGPEIAAFPTGTRVHNANETSAMLKPTVTVNVYEAEKRVEVEVGEQKVEAVVNRMDRRSARGANRGFARAGT